MQQTIAFNRNKTYGVILASPVGQRTPLRTSGILRHASRSSGPAALCIADRKSSSFPKRKK